MHQKPDRS